MKLSLTDTYQRRNILILGGLGFIGKVLIALLLEKFPNIGHIYLVLRGNKKESAEKRFAIAWENSPVFESVRGMKDKITVLSGDVSLPNFGLEKDLDVELIINSAGLVTFNPELKEAMSANVWGAIHATDFAKKTKAKLLHLSTCFVAGNQSGYIGEELSTQISPNGKPFDVTHELTLKLTTKEAIERAQYWGWPNIYTYTKAISEAWLEKENVQVAIVRPSIVESALVFPMPGWNEGFNTTAPLIHALNGWYPFLLAKKETPLDIIPVDILAKQILIIGAELLQGTSAALYQCSTSSHNPLNVGNVLKLIRKGQRQKKGTFFKTLIKIRAISPEHPLSTPKLDHLCRKFPLFKGFSKQIRRLRSLHESYLPFIYHNNTIFASDRIQSIDVAESEFHFDPKSIDWNDYWMNIHMPGLEQWCFSEKQRKL